MSAQVYQLGPAATPEESAAITFLAEGLPSSATVFANPWLAEHTGAVYELDAVVAMPHAIYVVEIKGWHGHVRGERNDWLVQRGKASEPPRAIRSPLKLARRTAQILHSLLMRRDVDAGWVWTQELIFLPAAASFHSRDAATQQRVVTRADVHAVLHDVQRIKALSRRRDLTPVTDDVLNELSKVLGGAPENRPPASVGPYTVIDVLDTQDDWREVLGRDAGGAERVVRIYQVPWDASEPDKARIRQRALWEAQVLRSFTNAPPDVRLPKVEAPIEVDEGVAVPIEPFDGATLPQWLKAKQRPLAHRVQLWLRIARTLAWTHEHGVVHRHLSPDAVLVADPPEGEPGPPDFQVTGFDLAKRLQSSTTVAFSTTTAERLEGAAPEVVQHPSAADPRADQFSLGLILALLALGEPVVHSTLRLHEQRAPLPRLRDRNPDLPQRLDDATHRMLSLSPAGRFADLHEAMAAVRQALSASPPTPAEGTLSPGSRIGTDYTVEAHLGEGGMAEVYKVKHKLLGRRYAIKVARASDVAHAALRREFHALEALAEHKHAAIPRAHDLTTGVSNRQALRLDFIDGPTLTKAIQEGHLDPSDVTTRRRLAEDLFGALSVFEQARLLHLDLKPDNLLLRPGGGLTVIDFSLARSPQIPASPGGGPLTGGTWEWRDPHGVHAGTDQSVSPEGHTADRYAAAMCLFFLHAGRHPFHGHAPEPGVPVDLDPDELTPPSLASFFERALHPQPEHRYRSTAEMREAYLQALGARSATHTPTAAGLTAQDLLTRTGLPSRALRALRDAGIETLGDLLARTDAELTRVRGLGPALRARVDALLADARARKLTATPSLHTERRLFYEPLASANLPLTDLKLRPAVLRALQQAGLRVVGDVASHTRGALQAIHGIGAAHMQELGDALVGLHQAQAREAQHTVLEDLWNQATAALDPECRSALAEHYGVLGPPQPMQSAHAERLGIDPSQLSRRLKQGREHLDRSAFGPVLSTLELHLQDADGILPLAEVAEHLVRAFPAAEVQPEGIVRLAADLLPEVDVFDPSSSTHGDAPSLLRRHAWFPNDLLSRLADEASRHTQAWPPVAHSRLDATLRGLVPEYRADVVRLARWLVPTICETATHQLYQAPVDPGPAVAWLLRDVRDDLPLASLHSRLTQHFGEHAPALPARLHPLLPAGWTLSGDRLHRTHAKEPPPPHVAGDPSHDVLNLDPNQPHEVRVRDLLAGAAQQGASFRLVVSPPESHLRIAASLWRTLGATAIDLADAWFNAHEGSLARDARAARMPALQAITSHLLHDLVTHLVQTHGASGRTLVLYNTGLLPALGGLDQLRLLYDRVQGGHRGLWIVVIPGVIQKRQPLLNNQHEVWHLPGLTLPLSVPLPAKEA